MEAAQGTTGGQRCAGHRRHCQQLGGDFEPRPLIYELEAAPAWSTWQPRSAAGVRPTFSQPLGLCFQPVNSASQGLSEGTREAGVALILAPTPP